jgi:hypothetical protein
LGCGEGETSLGECTGVSCCGVVGTVGAARKPKLDFRAKRKEVLCDGCGLGDGLRELSDGKLLAGEFYVILSVHGNSRYVDT